ncbi:exported protein of unknown function [Bradyrhizobium sp. ORS 285]|nr:exported hypothetical protein [Bradyrhizobium sp. ORS 285]SMX61711.1 exported protein of unknown function [Bradyrhizobium sp. ORS 285]
MGHVMRILTIVVFLLISVEVARAQGTGAYPNPLLTRGAIDPDLTVRYICSHSTSERRSVTTAQKKLIFQAYGVPYEDRADYEVDHFIPLSLGGVNTCRQDDGTEDVTCNLWPQPHQSAFPHVAPWGSETKDKLEYRLYRMMCAGQISLQEAQSAITSDWEAGYRQYVESPPVETVARPFTTTPLFRPFEPQFAETSAPIRPTRTHRSRHDSMRARPVESFPKLGDEFGAPRFDFHGLWIAPPEPRLRAPSHSHRKHKKKRR